MRDDTNPTEPSLDTSTYGTYTRDPSPEELEAHFKLSNEDRLFLAQCRTPHTLLGMALQLCNLRYLGTFITDGSTIPPVVQSFVRQELGIQAVSVRSYFKAKITRLRHQDEIRAYLGYFELSPASVIAVIRVLFNRLKVCEENEAVLFDLVTRTLLEKRVVLPGATTIERLIRRVRERVRMQLYKQINSRLSKTYRKKLEHLLLVPKGDFRSLLDRLRSPPTHSSSIAMVTALERLNRISEFTVSSLKLEDIAENRLAVLVKHGLTSKVQVIGLYSRDRCFATLAVTMQHLEKQAIDDVLTVFDTVMRESSLRAQRRYQRQRLRSLGDLDRAALTLRDAARLVLDAKVVNKHLRQRILESIGESTLQQAVLNITELTTRGEDLESQAWKASHAGIARFINLFLESISFEGQPSAGSLLEGISFLALMYQTHNLA